MKLTQLTQFVVLGLVLTVAVSGCRKRPGDVTPLPPGKTMKVPVDADRGTPLTPGPGTDSQPQGINAASPDATGGFKQTSPDERRLWPRDREIFKNQTVYFGFDRSNVEPAERAKVSAVADHLKANPTHAVEIEGHCDERGTEEYNRALGERRALALREALVSLGIDPGRIDTISYGKDRPADPASNEAAWRKNRRGEFILETPPN
jgi:peptidoglycan-associated lipoprotein